jgi:tripartite ATP-independent transporter DctM subunit
MVASALFAAVSGSGPASTATIGSIALPELEKRSYDMKLAMGGEAAGGALGILIPPSINLIVYGSLVGTSVASLFAAGMVPGVILTAMFMAYMLIATVIAPERAPRGEFPGVKMVLYGVLDLLPVLILITVVLGGIFGGIFTPTESAAVGVAVTLVISLFLHELNWRRFLDAVKSALRVCSMVLIVVVGAGMVSSFLAFVGMPRAIATFVTQAQLPPWAVIALVYLVYTLLGCFVDGLSAMMMTLPVTLPMVTALGFSEIWFGVILAILAKIGMLTPPIGVNVFVIQAITKRDLFEVFRAVVPFFLIMILAMIIFTFFPSIVLWLPSLM